MARVIVRLCNPQDINESYYPKPCNDYLCCTSEPAPCCVIYKNYHRQLWETWYFWFGAVLVLLFVVTSALSYALANCKRKQQQLVRIQHAPSAPPLSLALSSATGATGARGAQGVDAAIIQPALRPLQHAKVPARANGADAHSEAAWAGEAPGRPLSPPYPALAVRPVWLVRGSVPARGFRQTPTYTEMALPPGYVQAAELRRFKAP